MDFNFFDSPTWGRLTFYPAKSDKWKDMCRHCLLDCRPMECMQAHCLADERPDGRNGYYSIHQMPKT